MSGEEIDLDDLLGPEPLVDVAPDGYKKPSQALLERSRSYPVQRAAKLNTQERLKRALSYATEMPVGADVARRLGISYTTLKYWLQKSFEGARGDGFDIELSEEDENGSEDNTERFHVAWDVAMQAGVENVETVSIRRATGYEETLTYRGQVQYRYDPVKLATSRELGIPEFVPENYLVDQYGAPVPETIWKMDPDLAMFILKSRKPQVYGNKATMDVNVRGGVLVVPMKVAAATDLLEAEEKFRAAGRPNVTFIEGDDEEDDV